MVGRIELSAPQGRPFPSAVNFTFSVEGRTARAIEPRSHEVLSTAPGETVHVFRFDPVLASNLSITLDQPAGPITLDQIAVFGGVPDIVCTTDVTLRGLNYFNADPAADYVCVSEDDPELQFPVRVLPSGALAIENARVEHSGTLRVGRSEALEPPPTTEMDDAGNLLRNASFERWQDGRPAEWQFDASHAPFLHRALGQATEGRSSLALRGVYYHLTLSQELTDLGPLAGKLVVMTADCRAYEPNSASLIVSQDDLGDIYSGAHSGNGEWEQLRLSFRVPAFSVAESLVVKIGNGNLPDRPCYYDNVQLTIVDDEPNREHAQR
jgi:hypothetical protein